MDFPVPKWFQITVAAGLILIGAGITYGHIESQLETDHSLIVALDGKMDDTNEDIKDTNRTVHNIEKLLIEQNGRIKLLEHRVDVLDE